MNVFQILGGFNHQLIAASSSLTQQQTLKQQIWEILESPNLLTETSVVPFSNLLLQINSPFEVDPEYKKTFLFAAAEKGDLRAVRVILKLDQELFVKQILAEPGEEIGIFNVDAVDNELNETPLHIACRKGYAEIVEELINAGASVDIGVSFGYKPLEVAIVNDRLDVVKTLIRCAKEKSINLNINPKSYTINDTPLQLACKQGSIEIVEILINNGASIVKNDRFGRCPLLISVIENNSDVVKLLIKTAAEKDIDLGVNTRFFDTPDIFDGWTMLHHACYKGSVEIIEALYNAGALSGIAEMTYPTPLFLAVQRNKTEIVQSLIRIAADKDPFFDIDAWYRDDDCKMPFMTPLLKACKTGNLGIIEALLIKGASMEVSDEGNPTPLYVATQTGNAEIVRGLIRIAMENNVLFDIDAQYYYEDNETSFMTPLMKAAKKGYADVVEVLIDAGASIHIKTNLGSSLLSLASVYGRDNVVKTLIQCAQEKKIQLDINERAHGDLSTAMHCACEYQHPEVLEVLLNAGASVDLCDINGVTPFDLIKNNQELSRKFLLHVTRGEINTEKFFTETEQKFSSLIAKLENNEPISNFEEFFEGIHTERKISQALFLEIPALETTRSVQNLAKLFLYPQFYNELSSQAKTLSTVVRQEGFGKHMLADINKVSEYFASEILKLSVCIETTFGTTTLASEFKKKYNSLQIRFKNIKQLASSKVAAQSNLKLDSFRSKFDDQDLFLLLTAWNVGVAEDFIEDPSQAASSNAQPISQRQMSSLDSYINLLGLKDHMTGDPSFGAIGKVLSKIGLHEGRDLRAIGVDLDIEYYCAQLEERQGDISEIFASITKMLNEKSEIWKSILEDKRHSIARKIDAFIAQTKTIKGQDDIINFNKNIIKFYKDNGLALLVKFIENNKSTQMELESNKLDSLADYVNLKNFNALEIHQELSTQGSGREDKGAKRQRH